MSGVTRSQFTEQMKDDNYEYFWENYDVTPTKWEMLFEVMPSTRA